MRTALGLAWLLAVLVSAGPGLPYAQQLGVVTSDVVVIDTERLLEDTDYGKRLQQEIQKERDRLIDRNERIASELEAEEQELTRKRAETPADEFRDMADAFDRKVTRLRNEAESNSQQLERRREQAPLQFMRVVQPVLVELLEEADAVVMLDRRSVLLHETTADVTDLAITQINAKVSEGPDALPEPVGDDLGGSDLPELPVPSENDAVED